MLGDMWLNAQFAADVGSLMGFTFRAAARQERTAVQAGKFLGLALL